MRKKKPTIYKLTSTGILLVSIVVIFFIAYLVFSKTTVILKPAIQGKTSSMQIIIDANQDEIDLENFMIPGSLAAHEFEKTYFNIPIETKNLTQKATGTITIFNNRDRQQYLLIESQLAGEENGDIIFFTDQEVIIPANGKKEMTITAKEAGTKSNIPPQKFNFIKLSPSMQSLVYAKSFSSTQSGADKGTSLSQDDIEKAIEEYETDFFTFGRTEVLKEIENAAKTIRKELSKEEIIEEKSNIAVGTNASQFDLTIKGRITAIVFNEDNVVSLATSLLKKQADETEEFIEHNKSSIEYTNYSVDWDSAKAMTTIHLSGSFITRLSPSLFEKERLIGFTKDEAIKYLESFPEIQTAEIYLWPPWNNTIPGGIKDNIKIEVKNEF